MAPGASLRYEYVVTRIILTMLLATTAAAALASAEIAYPKNWPQWRGPLATGEAPLGDPPVEWDAESGKNIRWKQALPGEGHATPVLWGDRLFLTAAIPEGDPLPEPKWSGAPGAHDNRPITHRYRFVVIAIDRKDGKILWAQTVREEVPHEGGHDTGTLASASPVTDGKRVYAFFGSRGLYALDAADGTVAWSVDLGRMDTKHGHGEGSSPVLRDGVLVVNWDHEGASFVAAFEADSGMEKWRQPRDEVTSWATPIALSHDGRTQAIVPGTGKLRAYDLETGEVIWECGGLSNNIVASPVTGDGIVIAGSSYQKQAMLAIQLDGARGDITGTKNVLWRRISRTPYVPSPLLYRGQVYFFVHYQPILVRADLETGEETAGPFRLDGVRSVYASPVAAAGRIYITDLEGTTLVLSADPEPKVLGLNRIGEAVSASAAVAGNTMYLRGEKHLYCVGER